MSKKVAIDFEECIGCGSCAQACSQERSGILYIEPKTGIPGRLCTLCLGDPNCIKGCPNEALSLSEKPAEDEYYGKSPETIAQKLMLKWYGMEQPAGGLK